jgi:hypothetical protein
MGITSFLSGVLQPLSLSLATVFVEHIGLGTVLIVVGLVNLAIASLCALILPLRERDWKLSVPGDE